jgi:hypothetical protein
MLKWLVRIVSALVIVPVLGIAAYTGWNWVRLREDPSVIAYLQKNASLVDLDASAPFAIADADLDKRLIVLGEIHGMAVGQDLDFAMLRMLNAKKGIRFYVGEFDVAQAASFNAYLADGDEAALRRVFKFWIEEGAQWGNKEFFEKVRRIRALNATLPAERQIRFIGVDRVQDMPLMAARLETLLAKTPPNAWPGHAKLIAALSAPDARTANRAAAPLPQAAVEAARTMPTDAPQGADPAAWPALFETVTALSDRALVKGREATIVAALERLARDPAYANEHFYGFWGQFHVLDAVVSGAKPMVRLLNEGNSPFKDNTLSVNILNVSSDMMIPSKGLPEAMRPKEPSVAFPYSLDSPLLLNVNGINDLVAASKGRLTLFKLNGDGSPYPRTSKLGEVGGLMGMIQPFTVDGSSVGPNGATQYTVLAKDSPALTVQTPDLVGP